MMLAIVFRALLLPLLFVFLSSCSEASKNTAAGEPLEDNREAPEPASQIVELEQAGSHKQAVGKQYVAVTANPHATEAAYKVLARGGTAIDAAIAAQMVLGLVEPQSSGLGGGGFLLYWDAANKEILSYDGRETAPLKADENLFFNVDELSPMSFGDAVVGGRSVGVPGIVNMLDVVHRGHGKIAWPELFEDAIVLAENGFQVSERMHMMIKWVPALKERAVLESYLFLDDQPLPVDYLLKNAGYAKSLKKIAAGGADVFYYGDIAESIVTLVNQDQSPGQLSMQDFANYQTRLRKPVCKVVFDFKLCGMGPPSAGGTTVLSLLAKLEVLHQQWLDASLSSRQLTGEQVHAFIEASRLAFADRSTYLADPDFVNVPIEGLLSDDYIRSRAAMIQADKRLEVAEAGVPQSVLLNAFVTVPAPELPSTTHLSIVDQYGNIASLTSSIETAFGSRLMTEGFILNNQLTDFSFVPETVDDKKVANRPQGGKRPLSSMSPMIVFDQNDQPVMVIGSPGGKSIISYVARVIYETLALGRPLAKAVENKNIVGTGSRLRLENGTDDSILQALNQKGHAPQLGDQTSGLHVIQKIDDTWLGVADPRREGTVLAH